MNSKLHEAAGGESPEVSHPPRPATGGSPERPPRRPTEKLIEKEPYGDIEDMCDICGEARPDLMEVEDQDPDTGARWTLLVCGDCRERRTR